MKKVFLILTALLFALGISPTPAPAQSRVPGTPTGVRAARNPAGSTDVRVSWNAVSGATSYRVYYSTTDSGDGNMEGEPTTTSFTSVNNVTNSTHYFRVSAVNSAGEGAPSPWVMVGPVYASNIPAPTGVTAARTPAGSTDVRVSWNAVRGATSYRVYWSGNASGDGAMEGEPTTTSFTSVSNNTDSTHYFRVSAVNSAGEGAPSSWVSVGPVIASSIPAPTGVTAVRTPAGSTDVRVSWNAVRGATGYRVYWSSTNSGDGDMEGEPTTTSFTSTGNDTDSTHYFRVSAVDRAGEGAPSPWVSVGPVIASAPTPAPTPTPTPAPAPAPTPTPAPAPSGGGPTNWTRMSNTNTPFTDIGTIAWGNNRWIARSLDNDIAFSTDAVRWTTAGNVGFGSGNYDFLTAIAWGNNRWVAVGGGWDTAKIAYSADGVTWTAVTNNPFATVARNYGSYTINAIAWGGNRFVAVGAGGAMAYSADGVTWTRVSNSRFGNEAIVDIAYGGNRFVAVGSGGRMAYSNDGASWTAVSNSRFDTTEIHAIAYGGGRFVAVGNNGKMAWSTDGASWTAVANSTFGDEDIRDIAWGNNRFVAVGVDMVRGDLAGRMVYSADGVSWTVVANSTIGDDQIETVVYGGGKFIAMGWAGRMAYCDW
ncbi:MAG: fibronectin type III domain-containing protein [Treponema sp.]|nr:fibronectin type III domain-containing protein [Treponema sp.]